MICFRFHGVSLCFGFSFFAAVSLLCTISPGAYLIASAGAVFLHEFSHLLMMIFLKQRLHRIIFHGCGIRICPVSVLCSYQREIAVLLAGPVCNLLIWGLLFCLKRESAFAEANLMLGLVNLMPFRHMDGGAALRCIFSLSPWEPHRCEGVLTIIACAVLVLLMAGAWILGVENFTYYALCIYLFFAEIFR
ncbi:MAG: hypothetical protein IJ512_02730 [Ruminococcus sp.]|nr:hypothetical protein [Ruminococcus sp.]